MIENKFYKVKSFVQDTESTYIYNILLLEDYEVYKGHFPNEPVSPGVCSLQMIKECAEKIFSSKLQMSNMQQAKFIKLITPKEYSELELKIEVLSQDETLVKIKAQILHRSEPCLDYKAELTKTV